MLAGLTRAELLAELDATRSRVVALERALADKVRTADGTDGVDNTGHAANGSANMPGQQETAASVAGSEENLWSFFNTVDDLLFVLDMQGTIQMVNQAVNDRLGYATDELLGQSILVVHPPARRDEAGRIVAAMLAGETRSCPVPLLTRDGRLIPAETRVVKGQWSGQEVLFGVTKDLSELKASEEKFSKAFHVSPAPMAITDTSTGQYSEVNESFLQNLGFAREEVIGKTAIELDLFHDPAQRAELLTRMHEQGYLRHENVLVRARSGDIHNGIFSAEYIQLQDRSLLLTVMNDVTLSMQTAYALHQREEQYRALVEALDVSLCRWLPDTTLLYTNEKYRKIFGIQGNATGRKWLDFLPDATREATAAFYRELAGAPRTVTYEHPVTIEDGEERQYHWIDTPILNASGELVEFQSVGLDITERKQAEDALRRNQQMLHDAQVMAGLQSWSADMRRETIELGLGDEETLHWQAGVHNLDSLLALTHPDDLDAVRSTWMHATPDAPFDLEYRILVDGELRWLHVKAHLAFDETGHPVAATGMAQDITLRKQNEEMVHAQRDLARNVASVPTVDALWPICLKMVMRVAGMDSGGIYLFDAAQSSLDLVQHAGLGEAFVQAVSHFAADSSNVQMVLAGKMLYFEAAQLAAIPLYGKEQLRSFASIPITSHGQTLGCINVASHVLAQVPAYSRQVLETLAAEIGNSVVYLNAVAALRESQSRAQAMLRAIPDLMFRMNREGVFLDYKAEVSDLYAQDEPTLIGVHNRDISPPAFADLIEHETQKTLANNALQTFEYELDLPDRGVRTYEARMAPSGSDEVIAIVRDITERRHFEEQLRASEEKYRGLIESLDSVVATVDYDGHFLYVNDLGAVRLGRRPEVLIGRTMNEIFPEPLATRQLAAVKKSMDSDRALTYEAASGGGDDLRWYRFALQPIHDLNGNVVAALINATDIHDLKSAQEATQELNRTLEERVRQRTAEVQDLYENAPVGYHSIDANGILTMVNQTELAWLGYGRDEMIGRLLTDFITPATQPAFAASFPAFKQHGWLKDLELELRRKDGSTFPVLISATAIYDEDGNYLLSRSTVFDNTERKAAEEAQRAANLELERALRMKDEFLANMSHELRTPLNGILAISEIMIDQIYGPLTERQLKAVRNIESSGWHLLALINDLLDLTKLEAGKLELNLESVVVDDICHASLAFVHGIALKKHIWLTYQSNMPETRVQADPKRLKQMLVNLLSNAIKFTPEDGRVDLNVLVQPDEQQIQFAVQDNGIGIAAEDLNRIFQPFTQIDSTLSRQFEGTGLGLALVRRLAAQHGGTVHAESPGVPGRGSCFIITLPLVLPKSPDFADGKLLPALSAAPPLKEVARPQVLLAEDNEVYIEALGGYLEHLGYQYTVARTGPEALSQAQASPPDLVLMDIQLPLMDGLEVVRHLRRDPRLVTTPIVALTALAMHDDRARCLAAGATEYLSKPVRPAELAALIERLLKQ